MKYCFERMRSVNFRYGKLTEEVRDLSSASRKRRAYMESHTIHLQLFRYGGSLYAKHVAYAAVELHCMLLTIMRQNFNSEAIAFGLYLTFDTTRLHRFRSHVRLADNKYAQNKSSADEPTSKRTEGKANKRKHHLRKRTRNGITAHQTKNARGDMTACASWAAKSPRLHSPEA